MKKIVFTLLTVIAFSVMITPKTSALGFLNPSFEDPNEGRFWECGGCVNIANYVVQNTGAVDGGRFAVTVNGISLSQKVTVPDTGDTTRLVFWYRNKGNVKVKIKQKGRIIQNIPLEDSPSKWQKMIVDNLPQGKKVRVIIEDKEKDGEDADGSYAFLDDFKFRKINRTRVTVAVSENAVPIEDATIIVVTKKKEKGTKIYTTENTKVDSVTTNADGIAAFRIDPSTTKKYIVRISKNGITTTTPLSMPEANGKKKLNVMMEGVITDPVEEISI